MKRQPGGLSFLIAGVTLLLCWLMFVLFFHKPTSQVLFALGNVTVGTGVLLILLAMRTLRKRGRLEDQGDFTETTVVVKQGVYSVVRHPLYLGWLLGYPAAMLVSQHWLVVIVGLMGMMSMIQIIRRADGELIAKFGPEYEDYMREVPQLNIILGMARKFRS
ncbi:MAG: methyltransferase family protein [Anaerolineales bacterium]